MARLTNDAVTFAEYGPYLEDPSVQEEIYALTHGPLLYSFEPRTDRPDEFDEQEAFLKSTAKFAVCLGGTGCLAGEQQIETTDRGLVQVGDLRSGVVVNSLYGQVGTLPPFRKGAAKLYRVILSDGREFRATAAHRVLSRRGWVSVVGAFSGGIPLLSSRLQQSDACLQRSSLGTAPSMWPLGADRCFQIQPGFQGGCRQGRRLCDVRLQLEVSDDLKSAQLLNDARVYSRRRYFQDALASRPKYSHACLQHGRRATKDSLGQGRSQWDAFESHSDCKPSKLASGICSASSRSESLTGRQLHTSDAYPQQASLYDSMYPFEPLRGNDIGDTTYIVALEFLREDEFFDFTVPIGNHYALAGVYHHNSGKTVAAAMKTANYLLQNKPPRDRCPFWVIGESYEMVCAVCWDEKLSHCIPEEFVAHIDWYNRRRNWPAAVTLRNGWVIEFKSYEQGRSKMQARSIGGYWFNEEVPYDIVEEVQGRCRDYDSPGWADFTPIEVRDARWPELYEEWEAGKTEGIEFYHLNTRLNDALADGWADTYLAKVAEDMRDTREHGKFASFKGAVYKAWHPKTHVIDPINKARQEQFSWLNLDAEDYGIPYDWRRIRAIDFGCNNAFVCLWIAVDRDDRFYVYDEHYATQSSIGKSAEAIKQRKWLDWHPSYGQTFADHDSLDRKTLADDHGIATCPARKVNIHQGIEDVRQQLQIRNDGRPGLFVFKRCQNLIREMRLYKWSEGTDKRNPSELPIDKHNDTCDALRYGIHSYLRGAKGGANIETPKSEAKRPWETKASRFLVGGGR